MKKQSFHFALALASMCLLSACTTTAGQDFDNWLHNKPSKTGDKIGNAPSGYRVNRPSTDASPVDAAPVVPVQEEAPVDMVKPVEHPAGISSESLNAPAPVPGVAPVSTPAANVDTSGLVWHKISNYDAEHPSLPTSSLEVAPSEAPPMPNMIKYNPSVDVYPVGSEGGSYAPRMSGAGTGDFSASDFNVNQMIQQVFFPYGSSSIGKMDRKNLRELAQSLKRSGEGYKLHVVGHASKHVNHVKDPVKRQMINFKMAQKRANAVTEALIKSGANPDYVEATSAGDSQPNKHRHGKSQENADRRAEIYLQ